MDNVLYDYNNCQHFFDDMYGNDDTCIAFSTKDAILRKLIETFIQLISSAVNH